AATFVIAGVASMGLPGFSGFVAELQILIGGWSSYPKLTLLAGAGIVIGVAYTMRVIQKAFFGGSGEESPGKPDHHLGCPPISLPERLGALLLAGASLWIGLWPARMLDAIARSFDSPLFDALKKGGWR